jgi:hypothetical protein
MENTELDVQEKQELVEALNLSDTVVYKKWLFDLNNMDVVECPKKMCETDLGDIAGFFKMEHFVYEKNENIRDKLVSVFHAVSSCGGSVLILINGTAEKIDYYFGARVPFGASLDTLAASAKVFEKSMSGNFPGTKITRVKGGTEMDKLTAVFKNLQHEGQPKQICTVTGVAGLRAKEENGEKRFVQGIEKLIDSMRGENYSILLIADPVSFDQVQVIKRGYETLYSQLVPFASSEINYGENENTSISSSITKGLSKSISKSVTDTLTFSKGTSDSHTKGVSKTFGANVSLGALGTGIGYLAGGLPGAIVGGLVGSTMSVNASMTNSQSDTQTISESEAESHGKTEGETDTSSESLSETGTEGKGKSLSTQLKFENKVIKNLLDKIDLQLKRLDASLDTGMWNCSAYCLADTSETCKIIASSYQAILRGENSSVETGLVTERTENNEKKILPRLEKMYHPVLRLGKNEVTPSSFLSGQELAIHAGFPQSSVSGLPVLEMAAFGREISAHWDNTNIFSRNIELGKIYHMGKKENLPVKLDAKSLASHTFITGSTGSGKSNAIYQILSELRQNNVKFFVIEPAKGEYKNVFGNDDDVSVYGTNPALVPLLNINPFSFPNGSDEASKNIHILEHLDRMIEIFNVCWPMYAAMPAVLKDAIEVSYEEAGWNLRTSSCRYPEKLYPTFTDVVENIRKIIDSSDYSEENKGNYKGSLITRLKSLTNGINGMIFTNNELGSKDLFDENVIVDLSRVGSMETKALIMGILIMKLQEYRMTSGKMNSDLRHITVLEEAHNLLKRTSTEQLSESSNLLGKSVEMLANAIAEMRTYGEGFIIADQAPGLLDMSVIRNTNTKIILRLPDESDRELVGKAAGLNDDQIVELARLQCGVAAVYQNDWLQPVLCKIDYFKTPDKPYEFDRKRIHEELADDTEHTALKKRITRYLLSNMTKESPKENIDSLKEAVLRSGLTMGLKARIYDFISEYKPPVTINSILDMVAGLYDYTGGAIEKLKTMGAVNIDNTWAKMLYDDVIPKIDDFERDVQKVIMDCIIVEISNQNKALRDLPGKWNELSGGKKT